MILHKSRMEVHDVIYGKIVIPPSVAQIIFLDIFQRLRSISQLGCLSHLLPHAKHTRFDHCIGTYAKARQMLDALENSCPALIDNEEWNSCYRVAVELAALLHDVGHGPFSHTWERVADGYHHELNGILCVDAIFEMLPLDLFHGLRRSQNYGVELIKALILGDVKCLPHPLPRKYNFIFEIVNNKNCKLDVDKWDYLNRDCFYLRPDNDPAPLEMKDIFLNARVSTDGAHIEYNYQDYGKIYELFELRYNMHLNFYQIPKSLAQEELLRCIIQRSDAEIGGLKLRDVSPSNMPAFLQLTEETVRRLIADDPLFEYITDPSKLELISEGQLENNDSILNSDSSKGCSFLMIQIDLDGPGQTMPNSEEFKFHGNVADMPFIKRNNQRVATKYFTRLT